jgi:excisionase family DNA binding protein
MKTYTIKETAKKLGVRESTVRRWIRLGKLAVKESKSRAFFVEHNELERFIAEEKPEPEDITPYFSRLKFTGI